MASRLLSRSVARTAAQLRLTSAPPHTCTPLLRSYRPRSRNLTLGSGADRYQHSRGYAAATSQAAEVEDEAVEQLSEYPTTSPAARKILHDAWGYTSFRAEQEAVIARLLHGGSAVAVFPTGAGKSLLYQVAALGFGGGVTVVVSPLIALIKDQVQDLKKRGIDAAAVDSTMERDEVRAVFERVMNDEVRLLYVSPERLNNDAFVQLLSKTTVRLIAVDEAHCVYEWGNSFRPDYLRVARFVKEIKAERVLCVTATATPEITESISTAFGIPRDGVFRTSTYRPNLTLLSKSFKKDLERLDYLVDFLNANPGATIIYTLKRSTAVIVAGLLEAAGIEAFPYHAGIDKATRSATQDRFMNSDKLTIVATIAFGLGINKPNIRNIIHYGPPLSIENYAQEIGRAGRDGRPSTCLILTAPTDTRTHNFLTVNPLLAPRKSAIRRLLRHAFLTQPPAPPGTTITLPLHALARVLVTPTRKRKKQKQEEEKEKPKPPPLPQVIRDKEDATAAVMALLMKVEMECGVVKALPTAYGVVTYRGLSRLQKLDDEMATAVAEASTRSETTSDEEGGEGEGLWSFDMRRVSERVRAGRETLLRRLHEWEHEGVVEIDILGVAARYEVLSALPGTEEAVEEVVERVRSVVKMHEKRSVERRKMVLELVAGRECFVGVLAGHFGDGEVVRRRRGCGHCQWCLDRAERRKVEKKERGGKKEGWWKKKRGGG
ncbi:uncharacterized protein H6S33_011153 [Morchella sextelata]|uniref:uncharacterized protein n=1 Tax=Morchella sextelata TaxID=1174677 RepID=UPI001D03BFAB|nr:uncharacterized protein H6S33_011153 [Morchella sextelata]KAH0610726.1 hypothetical protein H6S33_011153 [Morchella sextelata]